MAFVPVVSAVTASSVSPRASVCAQTSELYGSTVRHRATLPPRSSSNAVVRMALGMSAVETLEATKAHPTLLKLAAAAGVDLDSISGTFFAPTEDAFARLPPGSVDALLSRPEDLRMLLCHHVVPEKYTLAQIKGVGYFEGVVGGGLPYEALGPIIRIGAAMVLRDSSNRECDNGIIHVIDKVVIPSCVTLRAASLPTAAVGDTMALAGSVPRVDQKRAEGACLPSTTGGRKAMGLIKQLPFWMYGPPYSAAKQEDYEPISIAQPDVAKIDYQIFPPGSVVVVPDEVSAAKLNPVSGFSKNIGQMKRFTGKDALSDYSKLD